MGRGNNNIQPLYKHMGIIPPKFHSCLAATPELTSFGFLSLLSALLFVLSLCSGRDPVLTYVLTCYLVQCFMRLFFQNYCAVSFPCGAAQAMALLWKVSIQWMRCCCQLSLSLILKTQLQGAVGYETKSHFALRSKTNASFSYCGEKSKTQLRPPVPKEPRTQQEPSRLHITSLSHPKEVRFFKLFLANVGTHDKNICHHASSCLTHRWGGVGRFLSLLLKNTVCCLLPTVTCSTKAQRGFLSTERSTWHIWSKCFSKAL